MAKKRKNTSGNVEIEDTNISIKDLKGKMRDLKKSIFNDIIELHETANTKNQNLSKNSLNNPNQKEKLITENVGEIMKKVNSLYDVQLALRDKTLEDEQPYMLESLTDMMEISPFMQAQVQELDNRLYIENEYGRSKPPEQFTLQDENKLANTMFNVALGLKLDPKNAEKTLPELIEMAKPILKENNVRTTHGGAGRRARKEKKQFPEEEELITSTPEEPIEEITKELETVIPEEIKPSRKARTTGKHLRGKLSTKEEVTDPDIQSVEDEPIIETIPEEVLQADEEILDEKTVINTEDEPVVPPTEPDEQENDQREKAEQEQIEKEKAEREKAEQERIAKEKVEQEQAEEEKPGQEFYDYRKNLPSKKYLSKEEIDNDEKEIRSRLLDKKGLFIRTESGKLRNAIRSVSIASNSKDIDATALLDTLYHKKNIFNKNPKISSNKLPKKLNADFKNFMNHFDNLVSSGKIAKADQEYIYQYIIRPRELVEEKMKIRGAMKYETKESEYCEPVNDRDIRDDLRDNYTNKEYMDIEDIDIYSNSRKVDKTIENENIGKGV
ncbi:MAG: hypothetical protein PHP54_05470 [Clostridia bacterium]|nr:hypothetical protein [Clostridia bacterium]